MSPYHRGEFQTHVFHVAPSMGLNHEVTGSAKLSLENRPVGNGTVYVQSISVAIGWENKME